MRILWHGPFETPTGYWNQAEVWIRRLLAAGHEVAVSCLAGVTGHVQVWQPEIDGKRYQVRVYPHTPYENFGQDVVRGHYEHFKADLCITLTCTWVLNPLAWRDMRVIHITPIDIEGMSIRDYEMITGSGGTPAAVCRWGETQMRARGLDPLYLPHGIDTNVFTPPENRKKLRQGLGMDHMFVVGINAGNHDKTRKRWSEALGGFAVFHEEHPKSVLLIHSLQFLPGGLKLPALVDRWGLADCVIFSDQYQLITGMTRQPELAAWYGALDVLLNVGNEGFGLPTVEAQACGTPVITAGWSASPELCGAGWQVDGQEDWNDHHEAMWKLPLIPSVAEKLTAAHQAAGTLRGQARDFALTWDADRLFAEHWQPVLASLG